MDENDIYTEPRQEYSPEKTLPDYAVVNNSSINEEERRIGKCVCVCALIKLHILPLL